MPNFQKQNLIHGCRVFSLSRKDPEAGNFTTSCRPPPANELTAPGTHAPSVAVVPHLVVVCRYFVRSQYLIITARICPRGASLGAHFAPVTVVHSDKEAPSIFMLEKWTSPSALSLGEFCCSIVEAITDFLRRLIVRYAIVIIAVASVIGTAANHTFGKGKKR
ncbi:hypothetical protein LX32DRAFT_390835 [Colletotrichum zoysiae]|uniref:Uncharacterized protein n=1 Tax=Colletotrichum zoysiae TaxID=1216348 RepID=A0AAD9HI36_9PEZI|nr:hypothetical protein LX32DRAFT_390835 [Colletotrichum zoysiae]